MYEKNSFRVRKDLIQYLFIYLMIISHDAQIYAVNTLPIRYGIIICGVVYSFFKITSSQKGYIYHLILFTAFMFAQTYFQRDISYFTKYLSIIEHLFILFVAININWKLFTTRYIKTVTLISAISIPFFMIQCLNPNLLVQILPATKGWGEGYSWATDFYGVFLYTYRGRVAGMRNNAIFTEPGIFQMVLNAAIFMLLFLPQECHFSTKIKRFLILFLSSTVITTGSTTGYIALAAIYLVYFITRVDYSEIKFKKYVYRVLLVGVVYLICDLAINQDTSILQTYVFGKFAEMGTVDHASGNARMLTISICLAQLAVHPWGLLTGVTYYKVNQALYLTNEIAAGCKIVPFMTAVGIPGAILLHWPYFIAPLLTGKNLKEKILCVFLYWNTAIAQSREMYPVLLMLMVILMLEEKNSDTIHRVGEKTNG